MPNIILALATEYRRQMENSQGNQPYGMKMAFYNQAKACRKALNSYGYDVDMHDCLFFSVPIANAQSVPMALWPENWGKEIED